MFEALSYSCMTPCLHPTRICGARGLATHAQLWLLSLSDNLTPRVEGAAEDPGAQQMQQKKKIYGVVSGHDGEEEERKCVVEGGAREG